MLTGSDPAIDSSSPCSSFRSAASSFQQQWRAYFEPRVLDAATLTPAEYAAAPSFSYVDEPAAPAARRVAMPLMVMAVIAAMLLAIGFKAYRGYAL